MALILIVDTDPNLSLVLQQEYQQQGHQALVARAAHDALRLAESYPPDLVVLNAALPRTSAAEIHRRLKAMPNLSKTRVLFYSIHLYVEEEPRCFQQNAVGQTNGASAFSELVLRSASLLRQERVEPTPMPADHLIIGTLILHSHDLTVERNGRKCALTPTEFNLLRYLMLHANEPCSASRLLQHVWGYPPGVGSTDLVRTHVRNLRHKLEDCPTQPALLRTMRHRGYMLCTSGDGGNQEPCAAGQAVNERRGNLASWEQQPLRVAALGLAGAGTYT